MKPILNRIPETLLLGPGPSCVSKEVREALAQHTIGHLDPSFIEIMDDIKTLLQVVMNTDNQLTFPISGTGSAGMETCFVNLIEPGDSVLVLSNGVFGTRMVDVAKRLGANLDVLEFPWGTPVLADQVATQLQAKSYRLVAMVHAETSTGVCNPVPEIGALVREEEGTLFLVDAVTSLGGIPVQTDLWGVDALYSGTQKCVSCPPGLSPISFSDGAVAKLQSRQTKVPNWYLDLSLIVGYWQGGTRSYHHTAPINMLYGLSQALQSIEDEGLEKVHARHREVHELLVSGLENLGLELLVDPRCRLPMLNAVRVPSGIDEAEVRASLLERDRIEIGGGLGPLAGKIWRIGLMGYSAQGENVLRLLEALEKHIPVDN